MRRVGERGEDQWERISWDEAMDEIVEKFTAIREEYGTQAIAFNPGSGNNGMLNGGLLGITGRLQNVMQATPLTNTVDVALGTGLGRVFGSIASISRSEIDFKESKHIVTLGSNITEAQIHTWHFIADALESGTELTVIDPVHTILASKADRYVPIRPATDAALALAMINVIVSEGRQNEEFLKKHTVAPFLIKEDGAFLRMSDLGVSPTEGPVDPLTGETMLVDPCVVWDSNTQSPIAADELDTLQIDGPVTIAGTSYATAWDLLMEEVAAYDLATASDITLIPEETIVELAHIAEDQPVAYVLGFGSQAFDNGVHAAHAMATLCAVTGNVGYLGASCGTNWPVYDGVNYAVQSPGEPNPFVTLSQFALTDTLVTGKYKGQDYPIKAMWNFCVNGVCCRVNTNEYLRDVVGNLDFIVTLDSFMTDTARYSDIVLPIAQFFEDQEVIDAGTTHYVCYSEKAIDPLYESKTDSQIVRMLADRLGLGEYFELTDDEYLEQALDTPMSKDLGISLESLREQHAIKHLPKHYIPYENAAFMTPSGRAEFYVEKPLPRMDEGQEYDAERERLPRFFPPGEAWHENEKFADYPIVLLSERPRFRVHSTYYNVPWLRELEPEPIVKINPADAQDRNIQDGDYVEVYNDRGHAVARAVYSEAMMPGVMVYPKGWQMNQHKAGCWSELSSSSYDPVGVNQSFMDELVNVRLWEDGE